MIVFPPPCSLRQIGVGQLETGVFKDIAKRKKLQLFIPSSLKLIRNTARSLMLPRAFDCPILTVKIAAATVLMTGIKWAGDENAEDGGGGGIVDDE